MHLDSCLNSPLLESEMNFDSNLSRFIQSDGRTVIIPIDHGIAIPVTGMPDPVALIEELNPEVDGYVVNFGLARMGAGAMHGKGICLRTDGYKPAFDPKLDEGSYRLYGANDASMLGCNAVMNMLYTPHPHEARIFREVAELVSESFEADMPVILEALPFGVGRPADYSLENIAFAVRMAAELGADIVKTAFPNNASSDDFRSIVESCYVPLVVLGGSAMGDDQALLSMVKSAIDAGAIGVAIGRNVWQHPTPVRIARALRTIVHDDASVDSALKCLTD